MKKVKSGCLGDRGVPLLEKHRETLQQAEDPLETRQSGCVLFPSHIQLPGDRWSVGREQDLISGGVFFPLGDFD